MGISRNRMLLSESFSASHASSAWVFSLPTSFFPRTADSKITGSPDIGSRIRFPLSHNASKRIWLPAYSKQSWSESVPFLAVIKRTVIYTAPTAAAAAPNQTLLPPSAVYRLPPLPRDRTAVINPPSRAPQPQISALCFKRPRTPPHFPKDNKHMIKLAPAADTYCHGPCIPKVMLTTA